MADHTLDGKGRLTLPSKLREKIGEVLYITNSYDKTCMFAFSENEWEAFKTTLVNADVDTTTRLERFFIANAVECAIDASGRVVLPQKLMDKYGITKNVTVNALTKRIEIWATDKWNEYNKEIEDEDIFALMKEQNIRV